MRGGARNSMATGRYEVSSGTVVFNYSIWIRFMNATPVTEELKTTDAECYSPLIRSEVCDSHEVNVNIFTHELIAIAFSIRMRQ